MRLMLATFLRQRASRTSRPQILLDEFDPRRNFEVAFSAVSIAAETIGFVSQKVAELSSLLLWELPKSYARSATVLVDELDASGLRSPRQS